MTSIEKVINERQSECLHRNFQFGPYTVWRDKLLEKRQLFHFVSCVPSHIISYNISLVNCLQHRPAGVFSKYSSMFFTSSVYDGVTFFTW